jgi:hypothetical protein
LFGKERDDKGVKNVYAKVGGRDPIYLLDRAILNTLGQELRNTRIFTFEPREVAKIKLTGWYSALGKKPATHTLERKGDGWAFKGLDTAVNNGAVVSFLDTLSQLQAKEFRPATEGKRFAPRNGGFTIELTLKDKKTLQLTLGGDAKDELCWAKSPEVGEDVFLVPKAPFTALRGKIDAFVVTDEKE